MKRKLNRIIAAAAAVSMALPVIPAVGVSAADTYKVTADVDGNGAVYVSSDTLSDGESYTLSAVPAPGYEFDHWDITAKGVAAGVKTANIAFVLDVSGSMSDDIRKVQKNLKSFINDLADNNITANMAFIPYEKKADFQLYPDGSEWSDDTEEAVGVLQDILDDGTNGSYERTTEALKCLINADDTINFPTDNNNYVFILTDEDCDEYGDASAESEDQGRYPLSRYTEIFKSNDVIVSVVAEDNKECKEGGYKGAGYMDMVTETGGQYIDIDSSDYSVLMKEFANLIDQTIETTFASYDNPYTGVISKGDVSVKALFRAETAPSEYKITVITEGSGTAYASASSAAAGRVINVTAVPGSGAKLGSITSTDAVINGSSFIMPAKDVTVYVKFVDDYSAYLQFNRRHSYIFSYDADGEAIDTHCNRKFVEYSDLVTIDVKLGDDYAGADCILYTGRKPEGGTVVEEAVLDENGNASFDVEEGKNFHLIVK